MRRTSTPEELAREFPNGPLPTVSVMSTSRAGSPADGTVVETAAGQPDIILATMTPLAQVFVRAARTYLQSLVGFLLLNVAAAPVAESLGVVVSPGDFWQAFQTAAGLAVAPTVIALLQNAAELLGHLDNLIPKWRA